MKKGTSRIDNLKSFLKKIHVHSFWILFSTNVCTTRISTYTYAISCRKRFCRTEPCEKTEKNSIKLSGECKFHLRFILYFILNYHSTFYHACFWFRLDWILQVHEESLHCVKRKGKFWESKRIIVFWIKFYILVDDISIIHSSNLWIQLYVCIPLYHEAIDHVSWPIIHDYKAFGKAPRVIFCNKFLCSLFTISRFSFNSQEKRKNLFSCRKNDDRNVPVWVHVSFSALKFPWNSVRWC